MLVVNILFSAMLFWHSHKAFENNHNFLGWLYLTISALNAASAMVQLTS